MAEQIYGFEALNLVMVCVDEEEKEEYKGRLYHQYREEPIGFDNILQMIKNKQALTSSNKRYTSFTAKLSLFRSHVTNTPLQPCPKVVVGLDWFYAKCKTIVIYR